MLTAVTATACLCLAQLNGPIKGSAGGQTIDRKVINEDPRARAERYSRLYQESVDNARAAMAAKDWGKARFELDNAQSYAQDVNQANALSAIWMELDAEGQRQLKAAMPMVEQGKFEDAIKELNRISVIFATLPSGMKAQKARDALQASAEVQAVIQEAKAAPMDDALNRSIGFRYAAPPATQPASQPASQPTSGPASAPSDRAVYIAALDEAAAVKAFEGLENISRSYPASPAGRRAAADVAALKADKQFADRLQQQKAAGEPIRLMNLAEAYRQAGSAEKAAELYQTIITKYPQSPQAREAAKHVRSR
jgi:tetratricopeptide (TPR) repeat protein